MKTTTVQVSNRGYIVIPAPLRKVLKIRPGTNMLLQWDSEKIVLKPVQSYTQKLTGLTKNSIAASPEGVDDYINAARRERTG